VAGFKPELGFISDNAKFGCAVVHYAFRRSFQIVGLRWPPGPVAAIRSGNQSAANEFAIFGRVAAMPARDTPCPHGNVQYHAPFCRDRARAEVHPWCRAPAHTGKLFADAPGSDPGAPSMAKLSAQNIPFELTRGRFGASQGAEFFGLPTGCKVSQCSTALPSASIL